MQRKIISIILAVMMLVSMLPSFSVSAATLLPVITLHQDVFTNAETSAAMAITAGQPFPGSSGGTASLQVKANATATGSTNTEGWNYSTYGIQISKYKFAKVTYYYDTNPTGAEADKGTGNAAGQKMKFSVGKISTSAGSIYKESGVDKWFGTTYSSSNTIVENQEATCTIDISAFATTYADILAANPTYDYYFQVKYGFFGLDKVDTLNTNDKMYIKKVEFYPQDPATAYNDITITFTAGTGTGTTFTQTATPYGSYTFPAKPADFASGSKTFAGWNYNGKIYAPGQSESIFDDADITIAAVWAEPVAYVSTDGVINGYEGTVYTSLVDAANSLGAAGGTIYIEGEYKFTSTLSLPNTPRSVIYIKGYNDSASGNILWTNTKGAHFSVNGGDVVIDNITIKNPAADETSWFTNGKTLTFGPSIVYDSTNATYIEGGTSKTSSSPNQLWLGVSSAAPGTTKAPNKINVQSAAFKASLVAPIQGYGTSAVVTGHTIYNLSAGTYGALMGTTRDGYGSSNGGKIYGDVTYELSGGTYSGIYTAGNSGKSFHYGNYLLHITGGIFNSTINFGGTNAGTTSTTGANGSVSGHQAIVVDLKEYKAASTDTDGITIATANLSKVSCGKRIVIINNAEENNTANKVTVNAAPEYTIFVTGGKAMPAFTPSSTSNTSTTQGALNGFYLTPDNASKTKVVVNGSPISSSLYNASTGVYDLSSYESTSQPIQISFVDASALFTTISFNAGLEGASGSLASVQAVVGDPYTLPANPYTKQGYDFAGWQYNGTIYYPGSLLPSVPNSNVTFTATWTDLSAVNTIYIDAVNGNDANSGEAEAKAVKTWARAYALTKKAGVDDGGTIMVLSDASLNGNVGELTTNMVTLQGKTGAEILSVTSQSSLKGPTTFKNLTFSFAAYNHINTFDYKVIFDEGIKKAATSPSKINVHAGILSDGGNGSYVSHGIDLTIKSGEYTAIYFGGAYLTSTNCTVNGDAKLTVTGGSIDGINLGADSYTTTQVGVAFGGNVYFTFNGGAIGNISAGGKLASVSGNYQVIANSGATVGTITAPAAGIVSGQTYIVRSGEGGSVSSTDTPGVFEIIANKTPLLINDVEETVVPENQYILPTGVVSVLYGAVKYQLSYDSNGATAGTAPATSSVYADSATTLSTLGDLVKDGYTFLGWEDADGKVYAAGASFMMPEANTVLTAKWWDPTTDLLIYADSVNGNDANTGYSMASAKQTLAAAYTALTQKGTIYLAGQFTPGTLPTKAFKVTLTSCDTANKAKLLIAANLSSIINSNVDIIDVVYGAGSNSHNNVTSSLYMKDVTGIPMIHVGKLGSGVVNNDISLTYENIITATPMTIGGAYIQAGSSINGNVYVNLINSSVGIINFGADSYGAASNGFVGGNITGNVRIFAEGNSTIAETSLRNGSYATVNDSMISIGGAAELVLSNGAKVAGNIVMPGTHAAGGNWVVKGDTGVMIQTTPVVGTYNILGATPFIMIVDESTGAVSYQMSGPVTLPAGNYSVYTLCGILNPTGDVLVDYALNSPKAPLMQNKIFVGYYNETQSKYIVSGDTIVAGNTVKAKYIDFVTDSKSSDVNFYIVGAQIRTTGTQGIRFINQMSKSDLRDMLAAIDPEFIPANVSDTSIGYGMVVFPTALIPTGQKIEKDSSFEEKAVAIVPAVNIYETNETSDYIRYTAVLTGITSANYETNYTVRPYITYKDGNGIEHTVYGEAYSTNLKAVALAAINGTVESETTKQTLINQFFNGVDPRTPV